MKFKNNILRPTLDCCSPLQDGCNALLPTEKNHSRLSFYITPTLHIWIWVQKIHKLVITNYFPKVSNFPATFYNKQTEDFPFSEDQPKVKIGINETKFLSETPR